jgi:DNA (cytosine-5)-methyltransferase 1
VPRGLGPGLTRASHIAMHLPGKYKLLNEIMVKKNMGKIRVLDLFCGAGGFSLGFKKQGFSITGVDINPWSEKIFSLNHIGDFVQKDLMSEHIDGNFNIILGGPPCRPFSSVNLRRRGEKHPNYPLVERYFDHISSLRPDLFFMENVPPVRNYQIFLDSVKRIEDEGYHVESHVIHYSEFGASTKRRRLIVFGGKDKKLVEKIIRIFNKRKAEPKTVGDAIKKYEGTPEKGYPDHEWPHLKTIHKYKDKYESGQYGWYKLNYSQPAPSFGNIMKTYILHPNSDNNGTPARVISVREAMAIMGFSPEFHFPEKMGIGLRYQMVVDVVSPTISEIIADVVKECYVR